MASRAVLEEFLKFLQGNTTFQKQFQIGDNINNHFSEIEKYFSEQNISNQTDKAEKLIHSLEENAKLELQSIPNFKDKKANYEWIKDELLKLYRTKTTKVSPIITVLNCRQENMSIREYLTTIRVAGMKQMPDHDDNEREAILINIFLKGINNRNAAKATELMRPKSLEEAFNLIKKEDKKPENYYVRKMITDADVQKSNEIEILKKRISDLEFKLKQIEKNQIFKKHFYHEKASNDQKRKSECYNCKEEGHIARNCLKPLRCNHCKKTGHIARFCKNNKFQQKQNIRQFQDTNSNQEIEYDEVSCDNQSIVTDYKSKLEDENGLFTIVSNQKKTKKQFRPEKKYPNDIIEIEKFINGSSKINPIKKAAKTMISESRSEPAANKPIVGGYIEDKYEKIFIDSGAESSIIDHGLFQKLREKHGVKLYRSNKTLSCANGSKIKVIGCSMLKIKIGNKIERINMIVVENLFPRVIIGIKEMKRLNIAVMPANDCIIVGEKQIPFISKVREAEN